MSNPQIEAQRLMLKGYVAETGLGEYVNKYQEKLRTMISEAKEIGEEDGAAAILAFSLIAIELAEESGV